MNDLRLIHTILKEHNEVLQSLVQLINTGSYNYALSDINIILGKTKYLTQLTDEEKQTND